MKRLAAFALVVGMVAAIFAITPQTAEAADPWMDRHFAYRVPLTLNNSNGEVLDYAVVRVSFNVSDVNWNHVLKDDASDVNFASAAGARYHHFRAFSSHVQHKAVFYVNVTNIAEDNSTIYMYYGNAAGVDYTNPDATFIEYDDFQDYSSANSNTEDFATDGLMWAKNYYNPQMRPDTTLWEESEAGIIDATVGRHGAYYYAFYQANANLTSSCIKAANLTVPVGPESWLKVAWPVLNVTDDGEFDNASVGFPSMPTDGRGYFAKGYGLNHTLYYAAANYTNLTYEHIFFATNATAILGNYTAHAHPCLNISAFGTYAYDNHTVTSPTVIRPNPVGDPRYMLYAGSAGDDSTNMRIFLANSTDGHTWEKYQNASNLPQLVLEADDEAFIEMGGGVTPLTIYYDNVTLDYYLLYSCVGLDGHVRTAWANSTNLINWTKHGAILGVGDAAGDWDEYYAMAAGVLNVAAELRIYYCGFNSTGVGKLGYAVAKNTTWTTTISNTSGCYHLEDSQLMFQGNGTYIERTDWMGAVDPSYDNVSILAGFETDDGYGQNMTLGIRSTGDVYAGRDFYGVQWNTSDYQDTVSAVEVANGVYTTHDYGGEVTSWNGYTHLIAVKAYGNDFEGWAEMFRFNHTSGMEFTDTTLERGGIVLGQLGCNVTAWTFMAETPSIEDEIVVLFGAESAYVAPQQGGGGGGGYVVPTQPVEEPEPEADVGICGAAFIGALAAAYGLAYYRKMHRT